MVKIVGHGCEGHVIKKMYKASRSRGREVSCVYSKEWHRVVAIANIIIC